MLLRKATNDFLSNPDAAQPKNYSSLNSRKLQANSVAADFIGKGEKEKNEDLELMHSGDRNPRVSIL